MYIFLYTLHINMYICAIRYTLSFYYYYYFYPITLNGHQNIRVYYLIKNAIQIHIQINLKLCFKFSFHQHSKTFDIVQSPKGQCSTNLVISCLYIKDVTKSACHACFMYRSDLNTNQLQVIKNYMLCVM